MHNSASNGPQGLANLAGDNVSGLHNVMFGKRSVEYSAKDPAVNDYRNWPQGMMSSSNGTIFCVIGPLCGEIPGPGEFHAQRAATRSFHVFFDLRLNKRLSKQPWGWWFQTPPWSLWCKCNGNGRPFPAADTNRGQYPFYHDQLGHSNQTMQFMKQNYPPIESASSRYRLTQRLRRYARAMTSQM